MANSSLEAEKDVLGAILRDDSVLNEISPILTPDDFTNKRHRAVYGAVKALYESGQTITLTTVAEQLGDSLKMVTRPYLVELQESVTSSYGAVKHAEIVKDKSTRRKLIAELSEIIGSANRDDVKTDVLLNTAEHSIFSMTQGIGKDEFRQIGTAFPDVLSLIEDFQSGESEKYIIQTRFPDLNNAIQGFIGGELTIIAGNPGWGKTELVLDILNHNAETMKKPCGLLSLEMGVNSLAMRILAKKSGVSSMDMRRKGKLKSEQYDKLIKSADALSKIPLYVDDCSFLSADEIVSKARKAKSKYDIKLLAVDYMQLMSGKGDRRDLEIAHISRTLKSVAKDLNIPVISLSQLSRDNMKMNRKPKLSDLRESGAIEQDADMVLFTYREPKNDSIIIGKFRNGAIGEVPMIFKDGHWESISHVPEPNYKGEQ